MNEKTKNYNNKENKNKKSFMSKIKFKTFFFLYMKMLFVDTDGYIGGVCNGKCAARYKYTRSITIFSGSTLQILSLLWRQVV